MSRQRLQGLAFIAFCLAAPFMAAWEALRALIQGPAPQPPGALTPAEQDAWRSLVAMFYAPAHDPGGNQ